MPFRASLSSGPQFRRFTIFRCNPFYLATYSATRPTSRLQSCLRRFRSHQYLRIQRFLQRPFNFPPSRRFVHSRPFFPFESFAQRKFFKNHISVFLHRPFSGASHLPRLSRAARPLPVPPTKSGFSALSVFVLRFHHSLHLNPQCPLPPLPPSLTLSFNPLFNPSSTVP